MGRRKRRKADLSSRVRSNHCVPAVINAFWCNTIRCLDSEHTLSHLIGFRLYAIADEPIWVLSKGSSTSCSQALRSETSMKQKLRRKTNLEISQQPQISCDLMRRCTQTREWCECIRVYFPRICLRTDGVGIAEPREFSHQLVQPLYFFMVSFE